MSCMILSQTLSLTPLLSTYYVQILHRRHCYHDNHRHWFHYCQIYHVSSHHQYCQFHYPHHRNNIDLCHLHLFQILTLYHITTSMATSTFTNFVIAPKKLIQPIHLFSKHTMTSFSSSSLLTLLPATASCIPCHHLDLD